MSTNSVIAVPKINKQSFLILWALCVLGFIAIIPYSYTLSGMALKANDLLSTGMLVSSIQNITAFRTVDLDRFVRRPAGQTGNTDPGWSG